MLKTIIKLWLLFPAWAQLIDKPPCYFKFVGESEVPAVFRPVKTCCSSHTGVISSN